MIICAGGEKGGVGKTTVATNLAIIRASHGFETLLIDGDTQETASDFTQIRTESLGDPGYTCIKLTGKSIRSQGGRLRAKYADIVIDVGGRDSVTQRAALSIADVVVVPLAPRSFDLWTADAMANLVDEIRQVNESLRACVFLNRCDPRGSDNLESADVLRENATLEFIDAPLGNRKAFANAAAMGLSVMEAKPIDEKAHKEMMVLYRYLYDTETV